MPVLTAGAGSLKIRTATGLDSCKKCYNSSVNTKTKTILTIMLCTAVIVVGGFLTWQHFHKTTSGNPQTKNVNYGPPTTAEKKAGNQTKQQNIENYSNNSPTPISTTLTIVRLDQVSPGQNVSLRTTLTNNVSGGQCVATFTQAGQPTVAQTTGIASNPSYYSCEPIDVSPSQFGNGGTWQVVVYVLLNGSVVSNEATGAVGVQR